MASELKFYEASDNYEDIVLLEDGIVFDATTVTQVKVTVGAVTVDSAVTPSAFVIPKTVTYEGSSVNGIRINVTKANTITQFNKATKTQIIVYSTTFPQGIIWDNNVVSIVRRVQ